MIARPDEIVIVVPKSIDINVKRDIKDTHCRSVTIYCIVTMGMIIFRKIKAII